MSWPYQVDGVDVFRLPPEGYEVDFDNPRSQKVLDHYLIFGIGAPLAFVALLQRFYTKLYLSKGLQVDDGMLPHFSLPVSHDGILTNICRSIHVSRMGR
jgi:hypothetical protein